MKKIIPFGLSLLLLLLTLNSSLTAQTEDFEGETLSGTSFVTNGATFNVSGDLEINEFTNFSCGGTNTGVNRYLSTGFGDGASSGVIGSITPTNPCVTFELATGSTQWGWTGRADGDFETPGTIRFTHG